MSRESIFRYARIAARAERKLIELLDRSLCDELDEADAEKNLQPNAPARRGPKSSG